MARNNRVRLSEQEKRIVDMTRESLYDGEVPRGVVIERACRNLLSNDDEETTGVSF